EPHPQRRGRGVQPRRRAEPRPPDLLRLAARPQGPHAPQPLRARPGRRAEEHHQGGADDQGVLGIQERRRPAAAAGAVPERRHGQHLGAGQRVHDAGGQQGDAGEHPQRRPADRAGVPRSGGARGVARLCPGVPDRPGRLTFRTARLSEPPLNDEPSHGKCDMNAPAAVKPVKINRWLPYWAVFQADVQQTLRSWVYRTWVLVSVLAAVGYLIYGVGLYRGAGIVQDASTLLSDLLRWTVLGSVTV